jgi:hypothetical protein
VKETDDSARGKQIADLLLNRYQLRVQPEMAEFVLKRLTRASTGDTIPVMAGDARTGVAVRQLLAAQDLQRALLGKDAG